jgi:Arc/MetJ family transcription regulator
LHGDSVVIDDLITAVSRMAGLSSQQSTLAVEAMLRFFTARLPSSLAGELHARLKARAAGPSAESGDSCGPQSTP